MSADTKEAETLALCQYPFLARCHVSYRHLNKFLKPHTCTSGELISMHYFSFCLLGFKLFFSPMPPHVLLDFVVSLPAVAEVYPNSEVGTPSRRGYVVPIRMMVK